LASAILSRATAHAIVKRNQATRVRGFRDNASPVATRPQRRHSKQRCSSPLESEDFLTVIIAIEQSGQAGRICDVGTAFPTSIGRRKVQKPSQSQNEAY
jgi:hypothetical protein